MKTPNNIIPFIPIQNQISFLKRISKFWFIRNYQKANHFIASVLESLQTIHEHHTTQQFNVIVCMSATDWKFWQEVKEIKRQIAEAEEMYKKIDGEMKLYEFVTDYTNEK